jgi:hypothetical protein
MRSLHLWLTAASLDSLLCWVHAWPCLKIFSFGGVLSEEVLIKRFSRYQGLSERLRIMDRVSLTVRYPPA